MFRVLAASLMSLAFIFTGTTAANSLQPANDHLLLDLPETSWATDRRQ